MPRTQAVNGYIFVTMSSNDLSLHNGVAAMSTFARSVLALVIHVLDVYTGPTPPVDTSKASARPV